MSDLLNEFVDREVDKESFLTESYESSYPAKRGRKKKEFRNDSLILNCEESSNG